MAGVGVQPLRTFFTWPPGRSLDTGARRSAAPGCVMTRCAAAPTQVARQRRSGHLLAGIAASRDAAGAPRSTRARSAANAGPVEVGRSAIATTGQVDTDTWRQVAQPAREGRRALPGSSVWVRSFDGIYGSWGLRGSRGVTFFSFLVF